MSLRPSNGTHRVHCCILHTFCKSKMAFLTLREFMNVRDFIVEKPGQMEMNEEECIKNALSCTLCREYLP